MNELAYRQAAAADMEWIYQLFKKGLKRYIDQTWGWNELFQHYSFMENVPATHFTIVSANGKDIGGYYLKAAETHYYLDMLLIKPAYQRQGFGRRIITGLQELADRNQLPVKLSVLKVNPAFNFYQKLGFSVESEDEYRYRLVYSPAPSHT